MQGNNRTNDESAELGWVRTLSLSGPTLPAPAPNGLAAYVPGSQRVGFANGTNTWQTVIDAGNAQCVGVTLANLGTDTGVARVELELTDVTQLPGWCGNGRFASVSQPDDDFSFSTNENLHAITVLPQEETDHGNTRQVEDTLTRLSLFCKDTGGKCTLTATAYDKDDAVIATATIAIPVDENDNGIADVWERDMIIEFNDLYYAFEVPLDWSPGFLPLAHPGTATPAGDHAHGRWRKTSIPVSSTYARFSGAVPAMVTRRDSRCFSSHSLKAVAFFSGCSRAAATRSRQRSTSIRAPRRFRTRRCRGSCG